MEIYQQTTNNNINNNKQKRMILDLVGACGARGRKFRSSGRAERARENLDLTRCVRSASRKNLDLVALGGARSAQEKN